MKENKQGNLNTYFTAEINEKMSGMSDELMRESLRDLEDTIFWTAILKYAAGRSDVARNWLYSLDPIKEPAQICRLQGMISGIYDLVDAVITIKASSNEKNAWKKVEGE